LDVAAPGGIVHANALNTILTGRWLRPSSTAEVILWVALMGVVGALAVSRRSWAGALAGVGGVALAYMGAAMGTFQMFGLVVPVVAPLTAFLLTVVVVPVQGQARGRVRLAILERQMREAESALVASRARLEAHDREFDAAIDEACRLREAARASTEKIHEVEARTQTLDEALHRARGDRDRLVAQVEELEQRLQDFRPVTVVSAEALTTDEKAIRAEAESCGIIIGDHRMAEVFQMIKKVAPASSAVLLMGETGTGKELVARALHALSPRARGPFVAVNMAAIIETLAESELFGHMRGAFTGAHADKKGRFEQADGGTLFLDEIGELPPDLQSKLLRVLQSGEVDRVGGGAPRQVNVRIIAATNRRLEEEVRAKRFREDLYYRLNVVQIVLPPLRDRPGDVERLAQHFLREFAVRAGKHITGFSEKAMHTLRRQEWRGNVRDLRNAVERAVVFAEGEVISDADLGLAAQPGVMGRVSMADSDGRDLSGDQAFLDLMREVRFEIDPVARRLGISRGTVASRLKGICFQALVAHDGQVPAAALDLAGGEDARVELKVREYYDNLIETTREFPNAEVAVLECRRRFKNLPQRYFPAVEQLIRRRFPVSAP
jgi:DNA-binding NtrC family response regulator